MHMKLYKLRNGKIVTGLLAGIAHKFKIEAGLVRAIFLASLFFGRQVLLLIGVYFLLSYLLPYKEDEEAKRHGLGPRKIKNAEKI